MNTEKITLVHDSIEYVWDSVSEEKRRNWARITQEALNTRDFSANGFPYMLQVEPTSRCNLSCTMCPVGRHELNRPYRDMRFSEFKTLIDDMECYLLFLVLWDWGEPLMNPELPAMIRYASERGIQTVTSTNGHFLDDDAYTEELLQSGLTNLIVAVDSLGEDRYEVYRKGGKIHRVVGGLRHAVDVKKRIGSSTLINVRMVIMRQNEHEIGAIEDMARDVGADVFTVKSLNPSCGSASDESLVPENPQYRRYEYDSRTGKRKRTDAPCHRVWTMSNIFSNGDVVPCCYDYDAEMKAGNIFETPFSAIWSGPVYRQLRETIHRDRLSLAKCRNCGINFKLSGDGWIPKTRYFKPHPRATSFSVIMPTHNRKHCIAGAIDSLMAQTWRDYELVIVDDGSTDGTEAFVREAYGEQIEKNTLRYVRLSEGKGVALARNMGVEAARNGWIAYLDSDNRMRPHFLASFVESIRENPSSALHYAKIQHLRSGKIIGQEFDFYELVRHNYIDLGAVVHSAELHGELGGFDVSLKRLTDWDLIIKYTERHTPVFLDAILLEYDDNPESSRITNDFSLDEAYRRVVLNYYGRIPERSFAEKYEGLFRHIERERDAIIDSLGKELADRDADIAMLENQVAEMQGSLSWRFTLPLREAWQWLARPGLQWRRYQTGARAFVRALHGRPRSREANKSDGCHREGASDPPL